MRRHWFIAGMLLPASLAAAEPQQSEPRAVHKEVQAAIDCTLPEIPCEQPHLSGAGMDVVDSFGTVNRQNVDRYKLERFERKEKRWKKCVENYKQDLIRDFGKLKESARHGLTQAQAELILANMAQIQAAVEAPDGIPAPSKQKAE